MEYGFDDNVRKSQGKHYRVINGRRTRVCDECGADMVIRTNRSTGEQFYGCRDYPRCLFTTPVDKVKQ